VRVRAAYLGLVCCLLAGCAEVDVTKTAKGFFNRTDPNEVEILKTRPDKPYVELATVTATGFAPSESAKMHNWNCPGFVDTLVKLPVLRVRAAARRRAG
jgi:hypothetical protein